MESIIDGCAYSPCQTLINNDICVLFINLVEGEEGGRYKFLLTCDKEELKLGCHSTSERETWVKWLVRATGQTDDPMESETGKGARDGGICASK